MLKILEEKSEIKIIATKKASQRPSIAAENLINHKDYAKNCLISWCKMNNH